MSQSWRSLSGCRAGTHAGAWVGAGRRVEMSLDPAGKSACATDRRK